MTRYHCITFFPSNRGSTIFGSQPTPLFQKRGVRIAAGVLESPHCSRAPTDAWWITGLTQRDHGKVGVLAMNYRDLPSGKLT